VEATLNAPSFGGGRAARRAAAHEAVLATGTPPPLGLFKNKGEGSSNITCQTSHDTISSTLLRTSCAPDRVHRGKGWGECGGCSGDCARASNVAALRRRLSLHTSAGGFDTAVDNYASLLTLARSQGAVGGQNRGACKVCGQLGHLTKQVPQISNLYRGVVRCSAGPFGTYATVLRDFAL
jgi:hypothetical protein